MFLLEDAFLKLLMFSCIKFCEQFEIIYYKADVQKWINYVRVRASTNKQIKMFPYFIYFGILYFVSVLMWFHF